MILLDTCAVIWDALDPQQLSYRALDVINQAGEFNALIISDITIWEVAMLVQKERIKIDVNAANFINLYLQTRNISVVQISPEIADLSVRFGAEINKDPADRIICATARVRNAQLVTADKNLLSSGLINTIW